MKIEDKFITSFFRVCVKLYKYDGKSDIEIKDFNEFLTKCNEKLSVIEDNELLNGQISELSKQLNKVSIKFKDTENKYVKLYNDYQECKKELNNSLEEKNKLKKNISELFTIKNNNEKYIELYKTQYKQLIKKYNEKKNNWKNAFQEIINENKNYETENENLSKQNTKYIEEINKIENLKKTLSNKLSSETIEHLDISLVDMIDKANEYERKYNELSIQNNILSNNYDELNGIYKDLLLNQTNETNELNKQIKLLNEQIEQERKEYNNNIILLETKNKIIENQQGGNETNTKLFNIRDKKAIGYFENDIKLYNEHINEDNNKYKQPTNRYKGQKISYSTDYMVDYLKVSDKIKLNPTNNIIKNNLETLEEIDIIESDIIESETKNNNKINNSIFIRKNETDTSGEYIDIKDMKIINESESNKKVPKTELKKELDNFIFNNTNNINKVVYSGGGKHKGKIEIIDINGELKMKINDEFTTLTEQNIDLKNDALIKKTKHRKYMRQSRKNNKLNQIREDLF